MNTFYFHEQQQNAINQIIEYGETNLYTQEEIAVVLRVAYTESKFLNNRVNPDTGAVGLFQYLKGSWIDSYGKCTDPESQIRRFFDDLIIYKSRYFNASTEVRSKIDLGAYVYTLHNSGPNSNDAQVLAATESHRYCYDSRAKIDSDIKLFEMYHHTPPSGLKYLLMKISSLFSTSEAIAAHRSAEIHWSLTLMAMELKL